MAAPREPVILAEQGGLVVAERGAEILVVDRGNGPSEIAAFVLVVLTLVFGVFGVVSLLAAGATPTISLVMLAIGICTGVAMVFTVAALMKRRRRPLDVPARRGVRPSPARLPRRQRGSSHHWITCGSSGSCSGRPVHRSWSR